MFNITTHSYTNMRKYNGCYLNVEMLPILVIKYKAKSTEKPLKFIEWTVFKFWQCICFLYFFLTAIKKQM